MIGYDIDCGLGMLPTAPNDCSSIPREFPRERAHNVFFQTQTVVYHDYTKLAFSLKSECESLVQWRGYFTIDRFYEMDRGHPYKLSAFCLIDDAIMPYDVQVKGGGSRA